MRKRLMNGAAAALVSLLLAGAPGFGVTPEEVFQTGKRAFLLGHWKEAADGFARFNETWPGHALHPESTFFLLLSESRAGFAHIRRSWEEQRLASLTTGLAYVRQKLPDADLKELDVERLVLSCRLTPEAASLPAVLDLAPDDLGHLMKRGMLPDAAEEPMLTLRWIRDWKARHGGKASGTLLAALDLWKARAFWRLLLSPMPAKAFDAEIRSMERVSLPAAHLKALKAAFRAGDPEVKREAALLGIAVGQLAAFARYDLCVVNEWQTYLRDRGNHLEGAWSPR
ncbi:MAG TPA: hypothetical protein PLP29_13560 [Candidatus Ozemobacteraceae bacterium]|nr:hypothetical protein [Candidatus Ozemobacteraceae bacterium]